MAEQTVRAFVVRWRGALGTVLLVVPAVISFLALMLLIGAWRDDVAIESHLGKATAEVVSVSYGRTIIRFATADGAVHSPPKGVLYPRGVEPGQLVRIEYDTRNPDLARIAERGVSDGVVKILATAVGVWVLAVPGWWLRRRP